ncbi:MAG: DUF1223 domain-containing protein [Pseudomonadota bacterium]
MTRSLLAALALGLLAAPTASLAASAQAPAFVELFTSQGCSSCPPADAYLAELAARDDVVALSFHVDYWDRLGWPDTLASPAYSARQRDYARARGDGQVYTPQIVVGGRAHAVGSAQGDVEALVATLSASTRVECAEDGGRLTVDLTGDAAAKDASVWLATFKTETVVPIARGENRDRTITYSHSVTALEELADWSGEATRMDFAMPALGPGQGAAVFVQTADGRVLGADYVKR